MTLKELRERFLFTVNRNDPDVVDHADEFINAGMRWCQRKFLGAEPMYAHWQQSESLQAGVGTIGLPGCYRHSAELRVYLLPERQALERMHPAALREPFLKKDGITVDLRDTWQLGTPRYFAVLGRSLALRPLPNVEILVEIVGTGWADPLTFDDDETVLTQAAPDACLYAAARECWLVMGDEPQATYWQTQAERAMAEWIADQLQEEHPPQLAMETPG